MTVATTSSTTRRERARARLAAKAAAVQLACYRLAWADIAGVDPAQVAAGFLYVRDGEDGLVRPPLPSRDELARMLVEPETGDAG